MILNLEEEKRRKENSDASTKIKTQKKKKKKKSIYQTGARDRIELAVRCERLLHVEGLIEMKNSNKSAVLLLWVLSSACRDFIHLIPSFFFINSDKKIFEPNSNRIQC